MAKKKKAQRTGITKQLKESIKEILDDGKAPEIIAGTRLAKQEIDILGRYKKMVMAGFNQAEIMETLKIDRHQYCKFLKCIPEELLDEWKAVKIMSVENSLYTVANGFSKTIYEDKLDKEGVTHTLAREVYYPPNITAIKYYLNNTKSRDWKDSSTLVVDKAADMPFSELEGRVREILEKKKQARIEGLRNKENLDKGVTIVTDKEES